MPKQDSWLASDDESMVVSRRTFVVRLFDSSDADTLRQDGSFQLPVADPTSSLKTSA